MKWTVEMGRKTRLKQEQLLEIEARVQNELTQHKAVKKCKVLTSSELLSELRDIEKWRGSFIRPIKDWKCEVKSKSLTFQRSSLIRYLFCKYPVPKFLETVWYDKDCPTHYQAWFLAVAQGGSLYKLHAKNFLTKKGVYYFLKAPKNYSVPQAFWWARVLSLGGDLGTAVKLARSKLIEKDRSLNKWLRSTHFFINNPQVTVSELNDFIDYIEFRNTEYSFKGRTLESLRKSCYRWHKELADLKKYKHVRWTPYPLADWEFTEEVVRNGITKKRRYTIKQLTTSAEIVCEGREMRHCVSSYISHCQSGQISIWSLSQYEEIFNDRETKCLTIEVKNYSRKITQARGLANRLPKVQERKILNKWANDKNLDLLSLLR